MSKLISIENNYDWKIYKWLEDTARYSIEHMYVSSGNINNVAKRERRLINSTRTRHSAKC